jgi:large subunit ribosomal protein L5
MTEATMREVIVEKVVVNIGVGTGGEKLAKAEKALETLTAQKPVKTISKTTNKEWGIKKGWPIGCKVTLRKKKAEEFLKRALWVKNNRVSYYSFNNDGSFAFGIPDYTTFQGVKYDPEIGIFGLDVCVVLKRKGGCKHKKDGKKHSLTKKEGIEFAQKMFNIEIVR